MSTVTDLSELSAVHDAIGESRSKAREVAEHERAKRSFWRELPILLGAALIIAVAIKILLFQAFFIPSASMEDTLQVDDRVLVNKLVNSIDELDRGDIIVFDDVTGAPKKSEAVWRTVVRTIAESIGVSAPSSELIKRVIALPGETVEVRNGRVFIDDREIDEPYVAASAGGRTRPYGPEEVPEGHVFVMGDNRGISLDSRRFGPVPEDKIVGRAFVIIWPPSSWSGL
jgi:signal peptidase I